MLLRNEAYQSSLIIKQYDGIFYWLIENANLFGSDEPFAQIHVGLEVWYQLPAI